MLEGVSTLLIMQKEKHIENFVGSNQTIDVEFVTNLST